MFVRYSADIKDNYISNNKVTYLKETKTVGKTKINYYYDGTIEVIKDNKSYLVRNEEDINITGNNVIFKNDNESTIIKSITLSDGNTIDYYEDGGAIIRNGSKSISIRKSNSIMVENDKIYEIIDNVYVTVSKKDDKTKTTYYTNGGAVVEYDGKVLYVPENSDIKYKDDTITSIGEDAEQLTKETNVKDENVKTFEKTAVVKTDEYIAIVPKDGIVYNQDGTIKSVLSSNIDDGTNQNEFTITNNTGVDIKYRVVIEKSSLTTLDVQYIKYQLLQDGKYQGAKKLDNKIWENDSIEKALHPTGINYILIDDTLKAYSTTDIKIMLWTDYYSIPNSMQDKYFYGTIRIYAWKEAEKKQ